MQRGKPEDPAFVARLYAEDCVTNIGKARDMMYETFPQVPELTDDVIVQLIKDGFTQVEIARRFRISQPTISRRVARIYASSKLEYGEAMASDPTVGLLADPEVSETVGARLWDSKQSYETNYSRLTTVFHTAIRPADRVRAITEMRRHIQIGQKMAEIMYNSERVTQFINTVTDVFRTYDPDIKTRIANDLAKSPGDAPSLARSLVNGE